MSRHNRKRWGLSIFFSVALMLLAGCATYSPLPLSDHTDFPSQVPMKINTSEMALPTLQHHEFNPANGLDMMEVAMLAVVNNPDLKAQRLKAKVAQAQLFAAHLLPDPQISASIDHPTDHGDGLTNAYGLGLNYDIVTLVTHAAGIDASSASAQQLNLDAMWQEWQVVQQARILYVQTVTQESHLKLLQQVQHLYAQRYSHSAEALKRGNLKMDTTGTDLTALLDANSRIGQSERDLNQTRHDLNALLGLAPDARLTLAGLEEPGLLQGSEISAELATLVKRRPDLLALQAGYQSQEATVHRAVLAQFPSLSVGLTRAQDTSGIHTVGFGITLNLPIFNFNRGEIAIQRATRAQLRQEYQARLDQTRSQIDMLQSRQSLVQKQRLGLNQYLPELERMVTSARHAYEKGDIDALTYLNMQNTLVNKRLEMIDLSKTLWDTRIALDTLLGWPDEDMKIHTEY
jgi:outer membrane protein TolC